MDNRVVVVAAAAVEERSNDRVCEEAVLRSEIACFTTGDREVVDDRDIDNDDGCPRGSRRVDKVKA